MKLIELRQQMDRCYHPGMAEYRVNDLNNSRVVIHVVRPGSVGSLPTVEVRSASLGIDWDNGTFVIYPADSLREIKAKEIAELRKEYDDMGWTRYEITNLKAEIKKLKEKLKKYESI